jgi:hypothetical protein
MKCAACRNKLVKKKGEFDLRTIFFLGTTLCRENRPPPLAVMGVAQQREVAPGECRPGTK